MMRKMLVAGLMLACVGSLDAIIRFKPNEKDYEYDLTFYEEEDTRRLAYAITDHPKVVITSDICASRPKVLADYKNIVVRIDTSQLNRTGILAKIIIAYAERIKFSTENNLYIVEEGSSGVCVYSCCLNPSFLAALTPLSLELEVVSKPKLFWREVLDSNAEGSYARYEDLEGLGGARNPAQRDELRQLLAIITSSYDSPEGILCQKVKDIDRLSEEILALLKEESYPSIQAFFERFDVDSHDDAGADVGGGSPRRGGASGGAGSAGAADGC